MSLIDEITIAAFLLSAALAGLRIIRKKRWSWFAIAFPATIAISFYAGMFFFCWLLMHLPSIPPVF